MELQYSFASEPVLFFRTKITVSYWDFPNTHKGKDKKYPHISMPILKKHHYIAVLISFICLLFTCWVIFSFFRKKNTFNFDGTGDSNAVVWNNIKVAQTTLKWRTKLEDSYILILKVTTKLSVIKTAWYRHEDRKIDQWNITENLETKFNFCSQAIFDMSIKII